MAITDPTQETLPKDIFNIRTGKILEPVRIYIFEEIGKLIPVKAYERILLVGSCLTLKYRPDSDLDVQIHMDPKRVNYYTEITKTHDRSENRSKLFSGRPVQFIPLPYVEILDYTNAEAVYDLWNNKWLKKWEGPPPTFEYTLEASRPYVRLVIDNLERQVDQFAKNPTKEEAQDVYDILHRLDERRKQRFSMGLRPSYSMENILYKEVDRRLGGDLATLRRLLKDYIESIK